MSNTFVALCCHPEAGFWPKDLNAEGQLDFDAEILRANNALRMTMFIEREAGKMSASR